MRSLLDQFVYFGFFQSIFLLLIYSFSAKTRKNINVYVTILVFVMMIGLAGRVLFISDIFGKNFRLIAFSEFSTLLFGSTIYLFTRSSLLAKQFSPKDLIHYVPGVIYILLIIFIFMLPSDAEVSELAKSGQLYWIIFSFVGVGLAFNIVYLIVSVSLFLKARRILQNEVSYQVKTQFFMNFLIAIGICLAVWSVIYVISAFGDQMMERERIFREFIWLSIASIILFIAFYGIREPMLFKITPIVGNKKYAQSKLSISDLDNLAEKLDQLMIDKKPYLNRKLLKSELAEMLGVSNPEIARLLNEKIGMNFFEYINYFRIREFIELAKSEKVKNLTFFGIAQEAGFNSKATFNKSFKNIMGAPPKEYFASQNA